MATKILNCHPFHPLLEINIFTWKLAKASSIVTGVLVTFSDSQVSFLFDREMNGLIMCFKMNAVPPETKDAVEEDVVINKYVSRKYWLPPFCETTRESTCRVFQMTAQR